MKVLYHWLKEFTDIKLAPAELRDRLSLTGTAVEGLADTQAGPLLDTELTINRPDCLGHLGMAREAATIARTTLRPVTVTFKESATETTASATRVEIESPELCGRYTARVVRGVKIGPSPEWLRRRLEALGQNSINNVADITNYVMLELGQPMHAFDFDKLAEKRIVVRKSRAGEKIRTLDNVERTLPLNTCVIADAARPIAIAGIMGGAESGISAATHNVLIEAAWFEPIALRRSSKALNLRSEASLRFERGADPEIAELASRRCAALIQEIAGGEILSNVIDIYPGKREPKRIQLSRQELLRVLGADVPDAEIEGILGALGFTPKRSDASTAPHSPQAVWDCTQPSWREDVSREIDLIEEVARHFGFEKFPPRLHAAKRPAARLPHAEAEDRLRERLIGLGYHEIVTIPLVNEEEDTLFRGPGPARARISNPLAADASVLRSTGLVSMAHALAWNLNRGQRNLRLFEIGRAYGTKHGAPTEMRVLTIGATGLAREKSVFESPRDFVFADLKGDIDQLGELAGGFFWHPNPNGAVPWQQAGRSGDFAIVEAPDLDSGCAGQLAQRVADEFKLRQDIFLAELPLDPFYIAVRKAKAHRRYHPISRFPAVERDFSLTLDEGVSFSAVFKTIEALGIEELTAVDPVDLFRGKHLPAGKFSLLVRVTFQSGHGTLTEAQVNEHSATVLAALESKLGATLRTA